MTATCAPVRNVVAFVAALVLATTAAPVMADPVGEARAHLKAGRYKEGYQVLNKAHTRLRSEPGKYAPVLLALADFYERHAGDFDEAARFLGEVTELGLPATDPGVKTARLGLARLKAQAARFKQLNEALFRLSLERQEPEVAKTRVDKLRAFIARNPGYPRLASAHYYLGKNLLLLERHREAHRAFVAALKLRPALGYHLPVEHSKESVYKRLVRRDLLLAARVVLGILVGLYLVLFLLSRPWKTLGLKHGLVLVSLLGAWWIFFRLAVSVAGETVNRQPGIFPAPIYQFTAQDGPMSQILDTLFLYGLVGVAGVFVMAVSTARFSRPWTWAVLNAAAAQLLAGGLMSLFYLDHAGQGAFKAASQGRLSSLRGDFYYAKQNQGPFLLTDPMAYCKFQKTLHEMDEEHIKAWFRRFAKACKARGAKP